MSNKEIDDNGEKQQSFVEVFLEEIVQLKWRALFVECLITIGSYYIYDFPGSIGTGPGNTIEAKFRASNQTYTQGMNLALYSVYSWPNTVLAIFGGLLIDKYLGLRRAMLLFCGLVTVGSGFFWLGVVLTSYPVIFFGRLCFGFGAESLTVSQSAFTARWFKNGRGLSLAFALTVSFSRVGSSFNFLFSPMIANKSGIEVATFTGFMICVFSMLACVFLVWLDRLGQQRGCVSEEAKEHAPPFSCKQLKDLPLLMWVISAITLCSYSAIFPFVGFAENFFEVKYGVSPVSAGQSVSLYQGLSAGGLPLTGFMVDVFGRHCIFLIASLSGLSLVHVLFLAVALPPKLMMALLALFYSVMVASLWTTVPFVVDDTVTGFAYGVMTAVQNFGLAVFPLITGAILDGYTPSASSVTATPMASSASGQGSDDGILPTLAGYRLAITVLLVSASMGCALAIVLFISDRRRTGVLAASPSRRRQIKFSLDEIEKPFSSEDSVEGSYPTNDTHPAHDAPSGDDSAVELHTKNALYEDS